MSFPQAVKWGYCTHLVACVLSCILLFSHLRIGFAASSGSQAAPARRHSKPGSFPPPVSARREPRRSRCLVHIAVFCRGHSPLPYQPLRGSADTARFSCWFCSLAFALPSLSPSRFARTSTLDSGPLVRVNEKQLPSPSRPVLSTQIVPPIASTRCLQIARPRPLPGCALAVAFGRRTKR